MEALHWQKVSKQYFLGDSPKPCFIEKNPRISGTPLWPKDEQLDCKKIENNLSETRLLLEKTGGTVFWGHILLSPDRNIAPVELSLETKPRRLATTFLSGFLVPSTAIQKTQIGFYPYQGEVPSLNETVKNWQGSWLLTNLGYFLTQKLMDTHNERHPLDEHLSPNSKGYLGGFFIRQSEKFIAYPPHFGTCGVGITKAGKPVLVDEVLLQGGSVYFDEAKLDWKKEDVNKNILFTPALSTDQPMGENKVNVVIFNEGTGKYPVPKIAYIKKGAILQPAAGIVFSLDPAVFQKLNIRVNSRVRFEFEPWFDQTIWENLDCFYEGLLKLTPNQAVDFTDWLHPNACLTQETYIPNLYRREPRAALVQTQNYFGAIAFSGRYEYSLGISFREMGPIVNQLISRWNPQEKIQKLVSLDGGSSVKLCLVHNGEMKPLNWIAPGTRNRIGDPDGNTSSALLIQLQEKRKGKRG